MRVDPTIELLQKFIQLQYDKKGLEEELEEIKGSLKTISDQAIELMAENGVQKTTIEGNTVYIHEQIWASINPEDKEAAFEAMRANDLGDLIKETVNTNTLSSWVRDYIKETNEGMMFIESKDECVPEELRGHIKVSNVTQLRMRKG